MNSKEPTSVKDRILAQIDRNEVRMHSRAYFAFKVTAAVVLAALVLLLTVFIGNLLFFTLRLNDHGSLLSLGLRGFQIFVSVFPWWLLALDIALSGGLVWLVRHFQFGYRKPIVSIFLGLVVIALVAGFALDRGTGLNELLLRDADDGHLPHPLDSVYQGARRAPPKGSAYRGRILAVESATFSMTDADGDGTVTVILPTHGPGVGRTFTVGEAVFVVGSEHDGIIQAEDVRPLDAHGLPPPKNGDSF